MPFTLAHPAAVLPLVRRPFVASALVAGAVAPDLLYVGPIYRFATQTINGNFTITYTHRFTSALWLDPLIAVVLLIYNLLLKRPLTALAPARLAARLPAAPSPGRLPAAPSPGRLPAAPSPGRLPAAPSSARLTAPPSARFAPPAHPLSPRWPAPSILLWTLVSGIIGALTHVFWDSFTHGDGYFVQHFPAFFRAQVLTGWDVNRVLQYVSTIAGCLVLAIWLYRWYRRTTPAPVTLSDHLPSWARWVVAAAGALLAAAGAAIELARADGDLGGETVVRLALSGLVSGGLAALGWYVVIWHLARLRRGVATL
ncbi:DUF4184 family protein [Kribbella sp. NPDC026611]|uniref:DUF4184 family protein n=1 Tax=Kribbella sp. NPDC026611 TaxID=3154911 RepID=UPI0034117176